MLTKTENGQKSIQSVYTTAHIELIKGIDRAVGKNKFFDCWGQTEKK